LLGQICEEKCGVCAQSARENNGRMNENKNGKNEDEFEKSVYVSEREKKIWALAFNSKEYRTRKF